jgi:hypothetical protein
MCERIFDRDICEIFSAATPERAATRRKKQSSNSISIIGRTKTLVNGSVFTIDGDNFGTRYRTQGLDYWTSSDERFFVC